ncbi:peroxide stress protein YaaA [Lachnospiraceae bacterium 62-35]
MNIIISPAKKMQVEEDIIDVSSKPVFLNQAKELQKILADYSIEELKSLYQANEKITELNYKRLQKMDLDSAVTPALLAYVGLQYQSMAANVFTKQEWAYVEKHLFILSGFYGLLHALDGIVPYRLEMQAKLQTDNAENLYQFWGRTIYDELKKYGSVIINLASKEYSRVIEPYLTKQDTFVTCIFGKICDGKIKTRATEAKIARGSMVRWMAEHEIEKVDELKGFQENGYVYVEQYSKKDKLVFLTF